MDLKYRGKHFPLNSDSVDIDAIRLKALIRTFTSQLYFGCQGPACVTPTCLTFQQRYSPKNADATMGRSSHIAARTQAWSLANIDGCENLICPNKPVMPWYDMNVELSLLAPEPEISDDDELELVAVQLDIERGEVAPLVLKKVPFQHRAESEDHSFTVSPEDGLKRFALMEFWRKNLSFLQTKPAKDEHLQQTLFSTASMRSFEWEEFAIYELECFQRHGMLKHPIQSFTTTVSHIPAEPYSFSYQDIIDLPITSRELEELYQRLSRLTTSICHDKTNKTPPDNDSIKFIENYEAFKVCQAAIRLVVAFTTKNGEIGLSVWEHILEVSRHYDFWSHGHRENCVNTVTIKTVNEYVTILDAFLDPAAYQLVKMVLKVISIRLSYEEQLDVKQMPKSLLFSAKLQKWLTRTPTLYDEAQPYTAQYKSFPIVWNLWLRFMFLKHRDGKCVHKRLDTAGAALTQMKMTSNSYYCKWFKLDGSVTRRQVSKFHTDLVKEDEIHIFEVNWIFETETLRRILFSGSILDCLRNFDEDVANTRLWNSTPKMIQEKIRQDKDLELLLDEALGKDKIAFFRLNIGRDSLLDDVLFQTWDRKENDFKRPLKIQFGDEVGIDEGGLTNEMFSLISQEAANPEYELMEAIEESEDCWFRPMSSQNESVFEKLGAVQALAIYNGVPSPFPLPGLFYSILYYPQYKVRFDEIQESWPVLHRNMSGDLSDADLDFTYTFQSGGTTYLVDMYAKSIEDALPAKFGNAIKSESVTEHNQEAYRNLYAQWLVRLSVQTEVNAFIRGFFSILPLQRLTWLRPKYLHAIASGVQVSIAELRRHTVTEGFEEPKAQIDWLFDLLETIDAESKRKFFKFVFARERLPGVRKGTAMLKVLKAIVPEESSVDGRFMTASTCSARLDLPEYSTREILESMVRKALEHAEVEGFHLA
jgi:hypothetical protein